MHSSNFTMADSVLRRSGFRDPLGLSERGLHLITLLSWPLVELGTGCFLVVVFEQSLVLAIFFRHLACFELDEKLLYILFSFLL